MIKLVVRDKRFSNFSSDGHENPSNSGQTHLEDGHFFKNNIDSVSVGYRGCG